MSHEYGYAKRTLAYDSQGNRVEIAHFGSDGQPVVADIGYARATWGYNAQGKASEQAYDGGCFWHLKGVVAWRLDDTPYSASRALHRGIALLQGLETPPARAYLGRLFDTFGQLLQHQGLLHDAWLEFERALDVPHPDLAAALAVSAASERPATAHFKCVGLRI